MAEDARDQPPYRMTENVVRTIHDSVLRGDPPDYSTRSQKGQSGNFKGRPKSKNKAGKAAKHGSEIAAQAAAIARRELKVRDGDGERKIDAVEASLLQLRRLASAGNVPAIRLLIELVAQHDVAEKERKAAEEKQWEAVCAYWEAHVARTRPLFADAAAKGLPAPAIYPHPDDVVFENNRVEFIGPVDEEGAEAYQKIADEAEFWFTQMAYDDWLARRGAPFSDQSQYVHLSAVQFWQAQETLPARMRMSHNEAVRKFMHYRTLSGRVLHRRLCELGRQHNMVVPPWRIRRPLTVPREACEIARRSGIDIIELWGMWRRAMQMDRATLEAEIEALEVAMDARRCV